MRVIVGLGNPGNKYSETRHNIGFQVVERLANKKNLTFEKPSRNYLLAKGETPSCEFSLLLPLTYMNLSGVAVNEFRSKFYFDYSDMLVVSDDINLPTGKIRLKIKGSDGGHNGLLSIINSINTIEFPRLRIGIGNNFEKDKQAEYVLSPFNEDEKQIINLSIEKASEICEYFLVGGLKVALEQFSKIQKEVKHNPTKNGVTE